MGKAANQLCHLKSQMVHCKATCMVMVVGATVLPLFDVRFSFFVVASMDTMTKVVRNCFSGRVAVTAKRGVTEMTWERTMTPRPLFRWTHPSGRVPPLHRNQSPETGTRVCPSVRLSVCPPVYVSVCVFVILC